MTDVCTYVCIPLCNYVAAWSPASGVCAIGILLFLGKSHGKVLLLLDFFLWQCADAEFLNRKVAGRVLKQENMQRWLQYCE